MTDDADIIPLHGDVERPDDPTTTWVRELRRFILSTLEPAREELRDAGDAETLARGWQELQPLVAELGVFLRSIQTDIALIMDGDNVRRFEVPGVGMVERERHYDRKQWDSPAVLEAVLLRALADEGVIDPDTGEVSDPHAIMLADRIGNVLASCLSMVPSTSWKSGVWSRETRSYEGGLRGLGLDPDDYSEKIPKMPSVKIPKKKLSE